MASVTLAESAKLSQNKLVAGVIENLITVNTMFERLPFEGIEGNALKYQRENALGDVILATVGTTFSGASAGKGAATFTDVTSSLTTIMGDAPVNGMIQATRSNFVDQTAIQIASKAKSAGRKYQDMLINGDGNSNSFAGLLTLCDSSQKVSSPTNGQQLSFALLDELTDLVTDKDGVVDWMAMNKRTIRSYKAMLRALGGATATEVVKLPSGQEVLAYSGTPIFRNDYIPVDQTQGSSSTATTVLCGTFDDGSYSHGISGLTASTQSGIHVVDVGEAEDADEHIWRVKWYCGLALFSLRGLAALPGITN